MTILRSTLDTGSESFATNAAAMAALVADLENTIAAAEQGGGKAARDKHLARNKLLPRERVRALIDPGSPFLELSQLVDRLHGPAFTHGVDCRGVRRPRYVGQDQVQVESNVVGYHNVPLFP